MYAMFRNSQYYSEPELFKPERWLKDSGMDNNLKAMSNLVWGHGARMCIGNVIVLVNFLVSLRKIIN